MTTQRMTAMFCGGIGESSPTDTRTEVTGLLAEVARYLDPYKFETQWHPWQAQYGPVPKINGTDYEESVKRGIASLARAIRQCDNDVVGIGYSAGATLWGRFLEELADGKHGDIYHKVKGVAFVAHPERRRGDSLGNTGTGFGIGREWFGGPDSIPTIELAYPDDVICCCPENSPLRTIADQTAQMSFIDVHGWALDLADRLKNNRWQAVRMNWRQPLTILRLYNEAIEDAYGYAMGGDHTDGYFRIMPGESVSYLRKLAQVLNASRFG